MLFLFEKPQIKIWIGVILNIRKKNKMETLRTDWISIPFFIAFSSFNLIFLFRYNTISSQTCSHWWIQSKKLFQQSQNCIALFNHEFDFILWINSAAVRTMPTVIPLSHSFARYCSDCTKSTETSSSMAASDPSSAVWIFQSLMFAFK